MQTTMNTFRHIQAWVEAIIVNLPLQTLDHGLYPTLEIVTKRHSDQELLQNNQIRKR